MNYRIKDSGEIKTKAQIKNLHRDKSLPKVWSNDTLALLGIDEVFPTDQPTLTIYQTATMDSAVQDSNGNWVESFTVHNMTDEEKAERDLSTANTVRSNRDIKLTESDWTQVADAPVDKAAWAIYRQALRDVPDQEGFPNEVTWPTEPVSEEPAAEVVAEEPMEEIAPE